MRDDRLCAKNWGISHLLDSDAEGTRCENCANLQLSLVLSVINSSRRLVTVALSAPYKYSYLLTSSFISVYISFAFYTVTRAHLHINHCHIPDIEVCPQCVVLQDRSTDGRVFLYTVNCTGVTSRRRQVATPLQQQQPKSTTHIIHQALVMMRPSPYFTKQWI